MPELLLIGGPVQIFSYIKIGVPGTNAVHFVIQSDESNGFSGNAEADFYLRAEPGKFEKIGQDAVYIGVSLVAGIKTNLFPQQATANANSNFPQTFPVHLSGFIDGGCTLSSVVKLVRLFERPVKASIGFVSLPNCVGGAVDNGFYNTIGSAKMLGYLQFNPWVAQIGDLELAGDIPVYVGAR